MTRPVLGRRQRPLLVVTGLPHTCKSFKTDKQYGYDGHMRGRLSAAS